MKIIVVSNKHDNYPRGTVYEVVEFILTGVGAKALVVDKWDKFRIVDLEDFKKEETYKYAKVR